jgi:methyl-accepting chemotaxis protein
MAIATAKEGWQMRLTLRTKFFVPILIIVIVGMGLLVGINDATVKSAFTQVESASMNLLCQAMAHDTSSNIEVNLKTLRSFAKNPEAVAAALGKESPEAKAQLATLVDSMTGVDFVNVYDASGLNMASSNPTTGGKTSVADRDFFLAVVKGGKEDVLSKALVSRTTGKAAVVLAQPLKGADGKVVGVLNAGMDLDSMTKELSSVKIGATGYAYIMDAGGMALAHPDKKQLMKTDLSANEAGKRIMAVTDNAIITYHDATGEHLAAATRDKITGWVFVVEAPTKEFNAYVTTATRQNACIALAVTLAILVTVALLLRQCVLKRLKACVGFAETVAEGDLDQELNIQSHDELHTLGDALNNMARNIKSALSEAGQKGEEALVQASKATEALEAAKHAQEEAEVAKIEGLKLAADRLQGVVETLVEASGELNSEINSIGQSVEEQERRTTETATAMEQMNATVMEVAKNAAAASQEAENARHKAFKGQEVVAQSLEAISKVATASTEVKSGMDALGQKAQSIGAIISVISDIADQTNLLALNAAIEAARAGEAGRGFAVVADEVRKLAEKTMVATKEVGEAISAIQQGVQGNVALVDKSSQAVTEATELAGASATSLGEIMELVQETTSQVQSIATAAEEQSAASEQINRAEKEVSRISADIAQGMRQSAGVIETLAGQINELEDVVATFRSDGEGAATKKLTQ